MPRKRSPREPTTEFHMRTRSRDTEVLSDPAKASTEDSSLSELGSSPEPPPPIPSSGSRKRIFIDSSSSDTEIQPKSKRPKRKDSTPTALPAPVKLPKRRGRPRKTRFSETSSTPQTNTSSPATQSSTTPSGPTGSSMQSSSAISSDTVEASPETNDQAQDEPPITSIESSPLRRRSLRNAKSGTVSKFSGTIVTSTPLTSSPTEAEPSQLKKRKSAGSSSDDIAKVPKRKRVVKALPSPQHNRTWKDREFWPDFDKDNKIYYAVDGETQYQPAEGDETPESRSPRKPTRGGGRGGRGGAQGNGGRGGRGGRRGNPKGLGGRGGSPDPPERRQPLTQDEKGMLSIYKARQQELKRFFSTVGAQQVDILEQMANRDLNKITKKANAHKKVPEYDMIVDELQAAKRDAEDVARKRYEVEVELAMREYEAEKEVLEQQCRIRKDNCRKEHLAGAEGDIILFERAYRAAHDDNFTESGSDMMDYFPHYHELPEPDTQPRGFSSSKITDEKAFKRQLGESFDEQARQEVLNEDVIGPLLQQIEARNIEWRAEQKHKKSQTMDALSEEATKQLEKIEGYLVPRPINMGEASSYALSALADVSEWVAQQHPQQQYMYMPLAKGDTFPAQGLDFSPLPGRVPPPPPPQQAFQQVIRPNSRPRGRRPKYPPLTYEQAVNAALANPLLVRSQPQPQPQGLAFSPTTPLSAAPPSEGPRMVSSGPGQVIAPAPAKAAPAPTRPNVNIFRHNTRYPPPPPPPSQPQTPTHSTHTRHNSLSLASPNGPGPSPQQFIFQTPQQQYQLQAGPIPPPTTPQYSPAPASVPSMAAAAPVPAPVIPTTAGANTPGPGPVGGQQTKMSMTFVNQTIESRHAATAATQSGSNGGNPAANEKSQGKRVLLPKGY